MDPFASGKEGKVSREACCSKVLKIGPLTRSGRSKPVRSSSKGEAFIHASVRESAVRKGKKIESLLFERRRSVCSFVRERREPVSPCWSVSSSRGKRQRSSRFRSQGRPHAGKLLVRVGAVSLCVSMLFSREREREFGEKELENPWSVRGFTLLSMIH